MADPDIQRLDKSYSGREWSDMAGFEYYYIHLPIAKAKFQSLDSLVDILKFADQDNYMDLIHLEILFVLGTDCRNRAENLGTD